MFVDIKVLVKVKVNVNVCRSSSKKKKKKMIGGSFLLPTPPSWIGLIDINLGKNNFTWLNFSATL